MRGNSIYNNVGLRARICLYKKSLPKMEELMSRVSKTIDKENLTLVELNTRRMFELET